jgi:hypothetical protein
MNALRRWLYRGTLSCAMFFLIALTMYNRTNHVNVKYHNLQCGIVTVRINTALVLVYWFLLPLQTLICVQFYLSFRFILSFNISVFINWAWYINIVTVNERIYIMVVMQLSVSIDYPFLIATFSSGYINLLHD